MSGDGVFVSVWDGCCFVVVVVVVVVAGDFQLAPRITWQPHHAATTLGRGDEFVILGCDGVWDVVDDQTAVEVVRAALVAAARGSGQQGSGAQQAAQRLVDEALLRGSTDNVSVVVVVLGEVDRQGEFRPLTLTAGARTGRGLIKQVQRQRRPAAAAAAVSLSFACVGSPCLRHCVHGASIAGDLEQARLGPGHGADTREGCRGGAGGHTGLVVWHPESIPHTAEIRPQRTRG
jgi:hypothetical protein